MSHPSTRSLLALALLVLVVSGASQWWGGHAQRRVGEQVAALAQAGDIRMLASDACPICEQARWWFGAHQVPFTECSIERDRACRAEFDARRAPGTPVLIVRGQPLLGFSPERVRDALARSG